MPQGKVRSHDNWACSKRITLRVKYAAFSNRLLKSVGVVPLFPTPQTRGQKDDSMESQPLFFLIHFWPERNPGVPDSLFKNQTVWDVAVLMRHTVSVSHYHKYKKSGRCVAYSHARKWWSGILGPKDQ